MKVQDIFVTNDGVGFGQLMLFPVNPPMISKPLHDKATALMVIWERWDLRHDDPHMFPIFAARWSGTHLRAFYVSYQYRKVDN